MKRGPNFQGGGRGEQDHSLQVDVGRQKKQDMTMLTVSPLVRGLMLLIARYNCFVDGRETDSVDYQVKWYEVTQCTDLDALLRGEPVHQ